MRVKQAIAIFSILGAVFVSVLELKRFIIRDWVLWIKRLRSSVVCCLQAGGTEGAAVCFEGLRAGEPGMWTPVWRPENQCSLEHWGQERIYASAQHSGRKWIQPFSTCLSHSVPYWAVWNSPSLRRTECFPQSTSARANIFQKHTCWTSGIIFDQTSLVAQMVKSLPAMREIYIWSWVTKIPLEKEMATHSNILVWEKPWIEEPGGLQSTGLQRVRHDWMTSLTHK